METQLPKSFYAARVAGALSGLASIAGAALQTIGETPKPQFPAENLVRGKAPILPKLQSITASSIDWDQRTAAFPITIRGEDLADVEEFALIPAQNLADDKFTAKGHRLSENTNHKFTATINLSKAPAGKYHAWVRNQYGQEDLLLNQLEIQSAKIPVVVTQPSNTTVDENREAILKVVATGTPPLNYQWRHNGKDIPGETSNTLRIRMPALSDAGNYDVLVSNDAGSITSATAGLTINTKPVIDMHPADLILKPSACAMFTVAASSSTALSYQWRCNGRDLPGATSDTLCIQSVAYDDAGIYDVVVSNAGGCVTSAAAQLTVNPLPSITTQPMDATVDEGASVKFTVAASGMAPLSYQWRHQSIDIAGATLDTFTIDKTSGADAGAYDVVVSNAAGQVASEKAQLTVNIPLNVTCHPLPLTVAPGSNATFAVDARGTGQFCYQWQKDGKNIEGECRPFLTLAGVNQSHAGKYKVAVSNKAGQIVESSEAELIVTKSQAKT